jgi:hypothetical protein
MGFTLQFTGEDGRFHTEQHLRATDALARRSELLSPPVNRPLVYVTDDQGGAHVERCEDCAHERVAYNSCRNRHRPKCQGAAARQWLTEREADLLPVPYYHVVFTLPDAIGAVALQNKAARWPPRLPRRPRAPRREERLRRALAPLRHGRPLLNRTARGARAINCSKGHAQARMRRRDQGTARATRSASATVLCRSCGPPARALRCRHSGCEAAAADRDQIERCVRQVLQMRAKSSFARAALARKERQEGRSQHQASSPPRKERGQDR